MTAASNESSDSQIGYRILFAAAAVYNVAFGVWAGFFPLAFFSWFDLEPPVYPLIWSCLGMVVGLYAILYAYVAIWPERGDLIAAVGLLGKILGPIGWVMSMSTGDLPPRTFPLILANDLIWWFPFTYYLLRHSAWRRTALATITVVVHLAACIGLLAISPATEVTADMAERADWVAEFPHIWTATWVLWAISSISLLAFVSVWAARLLELNCPQRIVTAGCFLVAVGLIFDLAGEVMQIGVVTLAGRPLADFVDATRTYNLVGPGAANGLYCIGGLILSAVSWRADWLRGIAGVVGIVMWIIGLGLTVVAVADHRIGMLVFGAGVMILFLPWASYVVWHLRPRVDRE